MYIGETMDLLPSDIENEIERALATQKERFSPEQYAYLRRIVLTNQQSGRLQFFLNKNSEHTPTKYVAQVAEIYERLCPYLYQVQVEKSTDVWQDLFTRLQKWCVKFLMKHGFMYSQETLDLAQEYASESAIVLLHARYPYDAEFDAWAVILTQNICRKHLRDDNRHRATPKDAVSIEDEIVFADQALLQAGMATTIETSLDLQTAINQLNDLHREVIWSFYFEDKSPAEIAIAMNLRQSTIYRLKFEALKRLTKILVKNGYK